jgi:membrane associated rhomboid family serine protease
MLYLWVFGDNIESILGHGRYVLFYFLGGIAASFSHILSLIITLPTYGYVGLDIPSVGASGSISAVLGAYLLLFPKARIRTLVVRFIIYIARIPAMFYLGFWFIYQFLMGVISLTGLPYGVAFWAHVGGFVFGMATVKIFSLRPRTRVKRTKVIRMRKCGYCGYENKPDSAFCGYCGTPLP